MVGSELTWSQSWQISWKWYCSSFFDIVTRIYLPSESAAVDLGRVSGPMLISSLASFLVSPPFFLSFFSLPLSMGSFTSSLYILSLFLRISYVQSTTLPAPGQPPKQATLGAFNIIGSSLVSAQQVHVLVITHELTVHAKFLYLSRSSSGHSTRFTS